MKANVAKDTGPERTLRRALCSSGLRGYRLNWKKAPGRPDIAFPGKKVAIFAHGCYWHRCPHCNPPLPKSNTEFWERKFRLNTERDIEKRASLEVEGWKVLEFWECRIKSDSAGCVEEVLSALEQK
jgi:DNA mismatch endonuclease (patch repair protein)